MNGLFQQKFKLISLEGRKPLKNGFKRGFGCSNKSFKFKFTFKSNEEGHKYQLDWSLSRKYNQHTGIH